MIDDGRCPFLGDLGIAQRGAASLGALLTARPAAQEPDVVLTVDCAHGEMALAREAKPLACRMDTRESSEVGAFHAVLLEHSWLLAQGLHTTRCLLSTSVMITGHYRFLGTVQEARCSKNQSAKEKINPASSGGTLCTQLCYTSGGVTSAPSLS